MKKLLVFGIMATFALVLFSSCGGTRKGIGCPSANSSKPFRA